MCFFACLYSFALLLLWRARPASAILLGLLLRQGGRRIVLLFWLLLKRLLYILLCLMRVMFGLWLLVWFARQFLHERVHRFCGRNGSIFFLALLSFFISIFILILIFLLYLFFHFIGSFYFDNRLNNLNLLNRSVINACSILWLPV